MPDKPRPGTISWTDLTVDDAGELRDFYRRVVGWDSVDTSMGDYDDFTMVSPGSDDPVAGICHARGANAGIPAQWLVYVTVADLDRSMKECAAAGGEVVFGPKPLAGGRFCVTRDPAGAVLALYET